jgi:ABC-2 type transport system ATP-binding protein
MIDVAHLSLRMGGRTLLHEISFRVEEGEAVALLGRNGSGKSLLLRVLATELPCRSGMAFVGEFDVARQRRRVRGLVGYVGEAMAPPPRTRVRFYLDAFARAHRIRERPATVEGVLALVEMQSRRDAGLETLSRGELQRLEIARALLHDPQVLLLDEPLAGLDPFGQAEMLEVLLELRAMGRTLLVATNAPDWHGDLFRRAVVLDGGRAVAAGTQVELSGDAEEDPPTWRGALLRCLARVEDNGRTSEANATTG